MELISKIDLAVPVERAYDYMTDLRNDPKWYDGVRNVTVVPDSQAAPNQTTYDQRLSMLGIGYTSRIRLTRTEPPRFAELVTLGSAIPFVCTYRFEVLDSSHTRLVVTATATAGGAFRLLGPIFAPMLRRRVRKHFAHLPEAILKS